MSRRNFPRSKMGQDSFRNLPLVITTDILSRLPIRAVAISKCVCKSWLHLLETDEFVTLHHSKSPPALAVLVPGSHSARCTLNAIEDEVDLCRRPLTNFEFPHAPLQVTAANDLLLVISQPENLFVCNPITREYVALCCRGEESLPQYPDSSFVDGTLRPYGLGASKISGLVKVVRIFPKLKHSYGFRPSNPDCHVYTLGTGRWRRVEAGATFDYTFCNNWLDGCCGAFLNGNLHWLVTDCSRARRFCCFDLETECFSIFSAPPGDGVVSVLRDCLCFCDHEEETKNVVIWLLKEYGVENSWTKEYQFGKDCALLCLFLVVYPIKVFKNGDILMSWSDKFLLCYSNETKTTRAIEMGDREDYQVFSMLFTPSFFSLKSLGVENVISF